MTSNGHYVSRYEHRVELVAETITKHTKLDDQAAKELAVHILQVIDHVPEKVR
ncbi:MAG TPA: DUF6307 family protein [Pseudonocardia sp.]|jgi:hypothetical protein|nr:DUF6307 family protein [Pseudonocardia sp.]